MNEQLSAYEIALLFVTAGDARGPKQIEGIINIALAHLASLGFAQRDPKVEGSFAWTITPAGRDYLAALPEPSMETVQ